MTVTGPTARVEAERVVEAVLADLTSRRHQGVIVDSPPGAGKSTLVVRAARELAASGEPTIIIAQTNDQVDDLVDRIARSDPSLPLGRLRGNDYTVSSRVTQHEKVRISTRISDLDAIPIIIATAAKWAMVAEGTWPWAIVDEGYQMRSDALLRVAGRCERALFVGDPGQLDPFSTVENHRWAGLTWDPTHSAMGVVLRHNPTLPVHRLPVSWRLPASAAPVVARAFYPFTGFQAGTGPGDRRMSLERGVGPRSSIDDVVEMAAESGWALAELPARHTIRTDIDAASVCVAIATGFLGRHATVVSETQPRGLRLSPDRIAIGVAHRDQAATIRSLLPADLGSITVDTANRLQGREYDVMVVLHPLSGRRDATAFHLETGRLCVLTSRHRHACVVVARAGIPELLDAHPSTEGVYLHAPVTFPDGWEAHQAVLSHLESHRVVFER